ncbi:hypothetical protein IWX64_000497 [Arthrobacter sp. CAN_A212]|uniref:hypothetical protein n=1 Tax=Arthrobacter sp. CAN_A212 TaxID=2787719 RepID=UPI0018CA6685
MSRQTRRISAGRDGEGGETCPACTEGLNLAGIRMVLVLEAAHGKLRDELDAAE